MTKRSKCVVICAMAASLAAASGLSASAAFAHHRHHKSVAGKDAGSGQTAGTAGAPLGGTVGRGPYAGAGGIYSPEYQAPGGDIYHLGGQLLGGEFGKAYEDYYRHYYYYKYAYCPLGSTYVIYLRRCVSPLDLLQ